jgi:hypothetical protein
MPKTNLLLCKILMVSCSIIGYWGTAIATNKHGNPPGITPRQAADYLHTIIQANRTIYTKNVVEWLQENEVVYAKEQWEVEDSLPLPAQMLLYSGFVAAENGGDVSFRLASLWPIRHGNGPSSELEQRGLEAVAQNPSRPYTEVVKIGQEYLFKAIYPDRAVSKVCVSCHNGHNLSPRKDYQLNDVMGGIIITLPVEEARGEFWVAPQKTAEYLHTGIHADRTVYEKMVVERLQEKGVVSSEEWKQRKTLPLPAQMIRYAGQLASESGNGIKYRLASLWPILSRNGPGNEFERRGLEAVAQDPSQPFTELVKNGDQLVFKAIYPDRAISEGCVNCHNGHKLSPRKDYQLNDVMGGVIISFPVR